MTGRRPGSMLLAGLLGCQIAGCSAPSVFGPVEFPVPPPELAADPTGAVVLLKEGTIEFFAPVPADEAGPHAPYVVVSERIRIRVTGVPHPSVTRWRVPNALVTRIDAAAGRLARPDGRVAEVDALPRGATPEGDVLLELPAAEAGDVIDVYTRRTLLAVEALRPWSFAGPAPAVESRLTVTAPEGWDVRIRVGNGERVDRSARIAQAAAGGDRRGWTVTERNVRAVPVEISGVDPQRLAPWAAVVLATAMIDGTLHNLADSWGTVATRVRAMLAETVDLDEEHAQQLRRGATKARLREVRRALRPVASEAGLFDRPPRPFRELAAGDASPIETAAVAAAAMQGSVEKAYLALVAPFGGPVLVDDLPGLYAFSGAVLALPTDGGWTFAAPACLTCPVGRVPISVAGGRALVVAEEGTKIVEIPLGSVEPNRSQLQFDWTVSVDGHITGSLLADLEGFVAQQVFRAIAYADDEEVRNNLLSSLLIGAGTETSVQRVDDDGTLEPGAPYPLRLQIRGTATAAGDGKLEVTPAELAGPAFPWVLPASRQTDLLLPAPLRIEATGALRLPPDYEAELPEKIEERMPFGEYSSAFSHSDGVITYRRRADLFARRVPVERYGELMEFFAKVNAADNTAILIRPEE